MKFRWHLSDSIHLIWITLGVSLYTFGFVNFNMANHLAEGGVAGITLILHALFGIDPAWATLLINLPLFVLGARVFGKKSLLLTIYGTVTMSFFIGFWQKIPVNLGLQDDMMLVAIVAGIFAGVGSGIVFRFGATTGGTDIIGRVLEERTGMKLGQTLLLIDVVVLASSLVYIDLKHMLYTLIASFVFSQVLTVVQNGGYMVRGMLIITKQSDKAAAAILQEINRGVTYLQGKGAYTGRGFDVLYVVLNPNEVRDVKDILAELDPDAFISVLNIDEVVSSDFKIRRKNYDKE
ncbi:YitT family protein [Streptococcus hyovaginalis]|uniref:YitT family protein n=1 Tax=Streptococcus TaxID=1301 RepID=UPI002A76C3B7|nr:YitT family protein [Streptococcus hyovaginalis]MDY3041705.1 YitT family protein [Streptococcus pluranimalium]MDY4510936.1 YitT family protein [Streptococcus hyovaginalis]MDY5973768.1 YitT family protein [Streptococcus hyovaginalis]